MILKYSTLLLYCVMILVLKMCGNRWKWDWKWRKTVLRFFSFIQLFVRRPIVSSQFSVLGPPQYVRTCSDWPAIRFFWFDSVSNYQIRIKSITNSCWYPILGAIPFEHLILSFLMSNYVQLYPAKHLIPSWPAFVLFSQCPLRRLMTWFANNISAIVCRASTFINVSPMLILSVCDLSQTQLQWCMVRANILNSIPIIRYLIP